MFKAYQVDAYDAYRKSTHPCWNVRFLLCWRRRKRNLRGEPFPTFTVKLQPMKMKWKQSDTFSFGGNTFPTLPCESARDPSNRKGIWCVQTSSNYKGRCHEVESFHTTKNLNIPVRTAGLIICRRSRWKFDGATSNHPQTSVPCTISQHSLRRMKEGKRGSSSQMKRAAGRSESSWNNSYTFTSSH